MVGVKVIQQGSAVLYKRCTMVGRVMLLGYRTRAEENAWAEMRADSKVKRVYKNGEHSGNQAIDHRS